MYLGFCFILVVVVCLHWLGAVTYILPNHCWPWGARPKPITTAQPSSTAPIFLWTRCAAKNAD